MASIDKLLERLARRPPEADFDDVRRLLEHFGWRQSPHHGQGTSHVTFTKPGVPDIVTIPTVHGRKVKGVYVARVCKIVGI